MGKKRIGYPKDSKVKRIMTGDDRQAFDDACIVHELVRQGKAALVEIECFACDGGRRATWLPVYDRRGRVLDCRQIDCPTCKGSGHLMRMALAVDVPNDEVPDSFQYRFGESAKINGFELTVPAPPRTAGDDEKKQRSYFKTMFREHQ